MFEKLHPTSRYEVVEQTPLGSRYCFYCEVSGTPVYTTGPIRADTQEEALELAWREAKLYFNGCSECGKWIRDEAYNIDEMKCIECAPCRTTPRYCTHCGYPVPKGNDYCSRCGNPIKEVVFHGSNSMKKAPPKNYHKAIISPISAEDGVIVSTICI